MNRILTYLAVLMIILMATSGCQKDPPLQLPYELSLPPHFPEPEIPEENQLTESRVALGKKLFYDPVLSLDSTISCASCHPQATGFADDLMISTGIQGRMGFRNVPTLTNVAYHPYFFREGGNPSLEGQVLGPICSFDEFGFNARELADRLSGDTLYDAMAMDAYKRPMDLYVITRAIAAFERTLISGNAPYDQFILGDSTALSPIAQQGMNLFFSERTACATCHEGFDFSNYAFENIGLYETYQDLGRFRITLDSADIGKIKVPTLRNVALTAPYMHDGSLPSLEAVIDHFDTGGVQHPNQSPDVKPLHLSQTEKDALLAFLQSLTDEEFIHNPNFSK